MAIRNKINVFWNYLHSTLYQLIVEMADAIMSNFYELTRLFSDNTEFTASAVQDPTCVGFECQAEPVVGLFIDENEEEFGISRMFAEVMLDPIVSELLVILEFLVICIMSRKKITKVYDR